MAFIFCFLGIVGAARAESACDSGCDGGPSWRYGPQLDGAVLPINAAILVFGPGPFTVTDASGASVSITVTDGPEGASWIGPAGSWAANQTFTLAASGGSDMSFTTGAEPDTDEPSIGALESSVRGFSTCNETMPVLSVSPATASDDQTPYNQLFVDVRLAGAAAADARVLSISDLQDLTVADQDDCFIGIPGVSNGDTITLELRFYDLAGNHTDAMSVGPVTLSVEHPDEGWLSGEDTDSSGGHKDSTCGCATGRANPGWLALLLAWLGLRRPREKTV